jgi:hypothetical protein
VQITFPNGGTVDKAAESVLRFIESRDILPGVTCLLRPTAIFLKIGGSTSAGIIIDGSDLSPAAAPVAFADGATAQSTKVRA